MMLGLPGHIGPEERRPVIPPLLGTGSGCCSVKPASRNALHSRSREALGLRPDYRAQLQLGVGRPTICPCKPDLARPEALVPSP
ncbi:hypothetical protein Ahy_B05g074212 [Arachis hypogaea]|uniref:Uncharacterized protein n=1 Tax=Arachis hypogaea TaxID=3818 RepID=A0A444YY81_ARAHY|nr:hypothetical protein Ahy_B05g074212 [Arachis hypogaea]